MERAGILNINKDPGMTSHDVVGAVRRILGIKRVGHTGTLDPMATGVLPVCVGRATRIIEYMDRDHKVYRCEMKLGTETDTMDSWGEILCQAPKEKIHEIDEERIRDAFLVMRGEIVQYPPVYSAVRVKGKHLYEYARTGRNVDIPKRKVHIYRMEILKIENDEEGIPKILFETECSRGTYIRSICSDIGRTLGIGGMLTSLARLRSGTFALDDAITVGELEEMTPDQIEAQLIPPDKPLGALGKVEIGEKNVRRFHNGMRIPLQDTDVLKFPAKLEISVGEESDKISRSYCVYNGVHFLGIAREKEPGVLKPEKVFV